MLIQLVFFDNLVCHCNSQWLHWMSIGIVISSYHLVEVVDHVFLCTHLKIITLQTKIIYSQLYNLMDQDEFNDFESAPAQELPKTLGTDELSLSVHSQPMELSNSTPDFLKDLSLEPSFSQVTNPPTEGSREIDNNDWYGALQPQLVKIESQMLSSIETSGLNFVKTHSQTDLQTKQTEMHFDYLSLGNFKVSQEQPTTGPSTHPQLITQSILESTTNGPEATIDFNYGWAQSKPQVLQINLENITSQPSSGNQDLLWNAQIPENNPMIQQNPVYEVRKQSEQFVIESEENTKQQQIFQSQAQKLKQNSLPVQQEKEQFPVSQKVSSHPVGEQEQTEARKESEQFVFQQSTEQQRLETQQTTENNLEPRKQSDDFVFQTTQTSQPQYSIPLPVESQLFQTIQTGLLAKRQQPVEQQPRKGEEQLGNRQQLQEKMQQQIKEERNNLNLRQQEDDEFGQFQQTIEVIQQSSTVNSYQIEQNGKIQSKIQIISQKAPYDMNIPLRAQELQAFVESLPDYSFVLAQAFNSL